MRDNGDVSIQRLNNQHSIEWLTMAMYEAANPESIVLANVHDIRPHFVLGASN